MTTSAIYKNAICRGSLLLGSGCGHCEKCVDERARLAAAASSREPAPRPAEMPVRIYYDEVQAVSALLVEFDGHTRHPSISSHVADLLARVRSLQDEKARLTEFIQGVGSLNGLPMTDAQFGWFVARLHARCLGGDDLESVLNDARALHPSEAPDNGQ